MGQAWRKHCVARAGGAPWNSSPGLGVGFWVKRHSHEPACDVMMITLPGLPPVPILPALYSACVMRSGPRAQMSIWSICCLKFMCPSHSTPTDSAGP